MRKIRFGTSLSVVAILLMINSTALAGVAETGWRAATPEEKRLREVYLKAQDDWNPKSDGEAEMYECALRWANWGTIERSLDDLIPTIAGDLTYSYADGQLAHYLTVLVQREDGDAEAMGQKVGRAALSYAKRREESLETIFKQLGKCYVSPPSWRIDSNLRITGPQLMEMLGEKVDHSARPEYVVSREARDKYDQYVIGKDFVSAANLGAQLHGDGDKTTVMWNEVLNSSRFAIDQGRGTELSDALLATLGKVWWPKWRRKLAANLLEAKHGRSNDADPPPYRPSTPAWAKQEYERFLRGETNYTPCNVYYSDHC